MEHLADLFKPIAGMFFARLAVTRIGILDVRTTTCVQDAEEKYYLLTCFKKSLNNLKKDNSVIKKL
jgi:hypothetical protein